MLLIKTTRNEIISTPVLASMAGLGKLGSRRFLHKITGFRCHRHAWFARTLTTKQHEGNASEETDKQTHFGFETVTEKEKYEKVYEVFHNVAETYDVMNDAMSGGVHRVWKDYFMDRMKPTPGTQLLDVAGGTGDIAFRFLKHLESQQEEHTGLDDFDIDIPEGISGGISGQPRPDTEASSTGKQSHVTVCDINQSMLDVGQRRAEDLGYKTGISWLQGNAECLPVDDSTYDVYTIAFGIRNVTHIDKVLTEAYRALKPGGRFMCLEFSQVPNPLFRRIYDEYSFQVIPVMGQVIAGDWKSYQYLVESIRKFPKQDDFADMIREAGFRAVRYENLMMGIAAVHSAFKL